ncbi:MAG: hypothetical protein HZB19_15860 [Chloroflexi bacterium]|nr:hypothetical protein [Chloroflexota bacterium]
MRGRSGAAHLLPGQKGAALSGAVHNKHHKQGGDDYAEKNIHAPRITWIQNSAL